MNKTYVSLNINGKNYGIADWIIDKLDSMTRSCVIAANGENGDLEFARETEKAYLVKSENFGVSFWTPKSQVIAF